MIFFFLFSGYKRLQDWVVKNHWDIEITHIALNVMSQIHNHKDLILYICITVSGIHAVCGLLMAFGTCKKPGPVSRLLFLPWLTLDMFFIVLTTAIFISWAFLSFFVHILVAIFSPVVSGAFLGLWIYCWRNVRDYFIVCGQRIPNSKSRMYRKLPKQSKSPTTEMRIVPTSYPHHQNTHHHVPV